MYVDGHFSHLRLEAAEFYATNGIILYCLLPNATHLFQPADVGVFLSMKASWVRQCHQWRVENMDEVMTKKYFPKVFKRL